MQFPNRRLNMLVQPKKRAPDIAWRRAVVKIGKLFNANQIAALFVSSLFILCIFSGLAYSAPPRSQIQSLWRTAETPLRWRLGLK
jgi:hypothetical protein